MTFELQRISYLVRHYLSKGAVAGTGLGLSVFAEDIGERFAVYLATHIMGQRKRIEIDGGPDGRWQTVRALFGLPYRRKTVVVEAYAFFPHLASCKERIIYRMEMQCDTGIPEIAPGCGGEAESNGCGPNLPSGLHASEPLPPHADA